MASDFVQGLAGVGLGGALAIAGSAFQSYLQGKQSDRRYEHERELGRQDHERRQAVVENEKLRTRLEAQLVHGRRVALAAMRFKSRTNPGSDESQLRAALSDAHRVAGLDRDAPSPIPEFLTDIEIEDDELRTLVGEHRKMVTFVDAVVFFDTRPSDLPGWQDLGKVDDLARRIELRYRIIQRQGRPL